MANKTKNKFVEVFNYFLKFSNEIFDFLANFS